MTLRSEAALFRDAARRVDAGENTPLCWSFDALDPPALLEAMNARLTVHHAAMLEGGDSDHGTITRDVVCLFYLLLACEAETDGQVGAK